MDISGIDFTTNKSRYLQHARRRNNRFALKRSRWPLAHIRYGRAQQANVPQPRRRFQAAVDSHARAHVQRASGALNVVGKQRVHSFEHLNYTLVLPQVFSPLGKVAVRTSVAPPKTDALRLAHR